MNNLGGKKDGKIDDDLCVGLKGGGNRKVGWSDIMGCVIFSQGK